MTRADIACMPHLDESVEQKDHCPACKASWQGQPIPEEHREKFYGGKTHFSRLIGVEISEIYDGIIYWKCPACSSKFRRFK